MKELEVTEKKILKMVQVLRTAKLPFLSSANTIKCNKIKAESRKFVMKTKKYKRVEIGSKDINTLGRHHFMI